ncbi:chemotaxis protein CheW [Vibrio sp. RE86]|uniref:chemotaxis protein CheW n=1 Tax=Vibrio sp. RE86 TaxID=2607605 RepID=UPI0014937E0A|nr:chemotaxis protein CheW [Vibrio sp. RE86]NOH81916.1 chemotaxis protein CheW [Vibrio sp. RE86]
MTNQSLLSSEQALDDYFSALLEESEEVIEQEFTDQDEQSTILPEPPELTLEPMVQSVEEMSYYEFSTEPVEAPNLEDVERLLKQLESSNPVAELDLEEVMDQNTASIAQAEEEVVELQDWDISEPEVFEPIAEVQEPIIEPEIALPEIEEVISEEVEVETSHELETQVGAGGLGEWQSTQRNIDFQVLYFDVNNVTFAVPLDELGGIHRIGEMNHLIGRPEWYLGLQTSREAQLDVVDTAKWVMAEKLSGEDYKDQYQYIVMLGESMWGLASTQLMGTESLNPEMVRWRETAGKRPWLAGMVTEKMCALIHVEALIAMLNAGLDVKALDN